METKNLKEASPTKPYTEADFAWDDTAIVADFKYAVLAYLNGTDIDTALQDIKATIIAGGSEWTHGDERLVYKSTASDTSTVTEASRKDWKARSKPLVDNDLFVDFDESLE